MPARQLAPPCAPKRVIMLATALAALGLVPDLVPGHLDSPVLPRLRLRFRSQAGIGGPSPMRAALDPPTASDGFCRSPQPYRPMGSADRTVSSGISRSATTQQGNLPVP